MLPPYIFFPATFADRNGDTPPSIDALARTIAKALSRTLRAYLPVETRSVEARLDALELSIKELDSKLKDLGESLSHSIEASWAYGYYFVGEGQAVLGGRVFDVKACAHEGCRDDSHAIVVPDLDGSETRFDSAGFPIEDAS